MNTLWHNHEWKSDTTPIFQFNDRLRLGDGIFDTMLVSGGTPIHPELHLKRLLDNAAFFAIEISTDLLKIIPELIEKNNAVHGHYALNTLITRGLSERGLAIPDHINSNVIMRIAKAPEHFPPVHAIISQKICRNEGSPLSQIKSCNYGDNILALQEAAKNRANEAIFLNNQGHVTCATSANIFIIKDRTIITPPLSDGVMGGITRDIFMRHHNVVERSFFENELLNADAVLLTNSIRGVQYIETLNGAALPGSDLQIDKTFHLK